MKKIKSLLSLLLCALMCVSMVPTVLAAGDYWGFDDYDTFENPNTTEYKNIPTTVTRVSDREYKMVSETEAGTTTITMYEEDWGTFNLTKWYLVDTSDKTHTFVGGSTDLEYVYRTSKTANGTTYFTGGNHGNEALVSFDLYDGETGQKITLSNGQSKKVNILHVIEKTNLLYFPDVNPKDSVGDYVDKNMSYTDSDIFAKVIRKYTFSGPQVKLNVDLDYVMDVWHGVSYTCMFPIDKKYGLYADMFSKEGELLTTIVTAEVGKSDYSGPMNSGNKATRALIYGKNNSQYQFDVRVNTYEDSLESQRHPFLTAFWDMNTNSNKLYFSKGNNDKLVYYKAGTQVHTEAIWQFVYDPEGREPSVEIAPSEDELPKKNLASGRDYQISLTNDNPGAPEYNTSYAANLTDGVASTGWNASDDSWFLFSAYKPNIENGIGSVTVELDGVYEITSARAHLINNVSGMGVKGPKAAALYGIVDGKEVKICDFKNISTKDNKAYWISSEAKGVHTDTVIFKFTLDGAFMAINEIEIQGMKNIVVDPTDVNLVSGKDYTLSGNGKKYAQYTASLTDGKKATSISYDNNWFTFYNQPSYPNDINAPGGVGTITFDLGEKFTLSGIKVNAIDLQGDSGIKGPKAMNVYLSDDGSNWGDAIPLSFPTIEKGVAFEAQAQINDSARYVKLEVILDGVFAFMNEVEVYGREYDPNVKPPVVEPEGKLGDVNNDGKIDQYDYVLVKRHHFNTRKLTEDEATRADANKDGKVDTYDYLLIARHYFGTYEIKG